MFELERRGLWLSAAAGLVVGLISAWVLWREVPPPREPEEAPVQKAATQTSPAQVAAAPQPAPAAAPAEVPPAPEAPAAVIPTAELALAKAKLVDGILVQDLGDGRAVEYSIVPGLQDRALEILRKAEVPFGALVAIEPNTGRVLAYADHSALRPDLEHLPGLVNPPAASVFKVITAAALLEHARVSPEVEVCYHGGSRGIRDRHLEDSSRDNQCRTLSDALGRSTNPIFGKLADRNLNPEVLDRYARAFAWNREIPFEFPVQMSRASFSDDRLTFAQTAAGFYHTHLSPMHGALVAAAVANGGVMMTPRIVERYRVDGEPVVQPQPTPLTRAVQERTARILTDMMVNTTETGTAGPYFRNRDPIMAGVRVAGKTGSLSAKTDDGTRHHFSWFVGFAPAENPRIAVAALVVNVGGWRIKSTYLAREVLETYFDLVEKDQLSGR